MSKKAVSFDDVWLSVESRDKTLKRWAIILFSLLIHFTVIFFVIYGSVLVTETKFPPLKVIDVYFSNPPPEAPKTMRAARRRTQKRTKLVEKKKKIEKKKILPPSALITPIEVPSVISDEDEEFLVSDIDYGPGGGIEGGVEGGYDDGIEGGSLLGVIGEEKIEPVRITGTDPKLVKYIKPEYPADALRFRKTGYVVIDATVDKYGKVQDCKIIAIVGHQSFGKAAIKAIMQWEYAPYLKNGKLTPFIISVTASFDKAI